MNHSSNKPRLNRVFYISASVIALLVLFGAVRPTLFAEIAGNTRPPLAGLADGMELVRLYVQRHAHRQGVGQALLQQVEERLQASDRPCLWLAVWAQNHRAQAFYQAQGYVCAGSTAYEFGGNAYANQVFCKRW